MTDALIVGCDTGGTFTDVYAVTDDGIVVVKVPSNPSAPHEAIAQGVARAAQRVVRLVHGSTIATNAILERRGARTALVTTQGFRDVIEIGRQARPRIYELEPRRPEPLVPRELRFEVRERVRADGTVELALDETALPALVQALSATGAESVAVSLLFSFLEPGHEQAIARILRASGFAVSVSSEVAPEYREYERTSTVAVNAYVAPLMSRYLSALAEDLKAIGVDELQVMNSAGGVVTPDEAGTIAAQTVLSGPAGGVAGAFYVAADAGFDRIISFDMGGTSTDVALCDGELTIQTESAIAGLPVRLPSVDVHTVGAGGGSIAWLDSAGSLRVGPQSVGAVPGPAAYGQGALPAVTDAHVVLGHLPAPLAGSMSLDREAARRALAGIPGFKSVEEAAEAMLAVVDAHMERALRTVSLERGHDPRDFTLVPFGGAGPLHACPLAEALGISRILVPEHPGVLSAVGMSRAPRRTERSVPLHLPLSGDDAGERLAAAAAVLREGAPGGEHAWYGDVRYRGQAYELRAPLPVLAAAGAVTALHDAHLKRYGFVPTGEPELVNLRLVTTEPLKARANGSRASAGRTSETEALFRGVRATVAWVDRGALAPGGVLEGPAIVTQYDCTTLLYPGWSARVDEHGNLLLEPAG